MSEQAFVRLYAFISSVKSPHLVLLRVFSVIASSMPAFNISSNSCKFFGVEFLFTRSFLHNDT